MSKCVFSRKGYHIANQFEDFLYVIAKYIHPWSEYCTACLLAKSCKVISQPEEFHTGIWSLGFDPKYFGWSGGETLYWRLTNTKVISANFSNLAAILIIFQSTAAVFAKVLAMSHKYSLQGDECTEGTKALFSVGEELGYEIYRSGLGNYLCCKLEIIYGAWNHTCKKREIAEIHLRKFSWIFRKILG